MEGVAISDPPPWLHLSEIYRHLELVEFTFARILSNRITEEVRGRWRERAVLNPSSARLDLRNLDPFLGPYNRE